MVNKFYHDKSNIEQYINDLIDKKYTLKQVSIFTGYSTVHLCNLKKQYKIKGATIFINGHKGQTPKNKVKESQKQEIIKIYKNDFEGYNFQFFQRQLKIFYDISYSYKTIYNILTSEKITSPKNHKIRKKDKKHLPRERREKPGEMIQIDASPFQWFSWCGDTKYYSLHGAIDDATEEVTGLCMSENECSYGYYDILEQTITNYGLPVEIYSDRSAIFCVTPKNKNNLTIQEQLDGLHEKRTQWQRILSELRINQILAYSAQAKGRIERLWETLQGRLTWYFKKYNIKTVEEANKFLKTKYIKIFNDEFSIRRESTICWRTPPVNMENIICAKFKRRCNSARVISFQGCKFLVKASNCAHKDIELCIFKDDIKACIDNKYYKVEILDDVTYKASDTMSESLKDIIYKYMYADAKGVSA